MCWMILSCKKEIIMVFPLHCRWNIGTSNLSTRITSIIDWMIWKQSKLYYLINYGTAIRCLWNKFWTIHCMLISITASKIVTFEIIAWSNWGRNCSYTTICCWPYLTWSCLPESSLSRRRCVNCTECIISCWCYQILSIYSH